MKNKVVLILLVIGSCLKVNAQAPETALEYLEFLSEKEVSLSKKYLSYMSEVAHGNRARKMEKRRQEVITEIKQSLTAVTRLKPYKGDASLRDAYKKYWDLLLKVFNEDYHKIVDMEEIAEQSYDAMEAYLLAQEKAEEVLDNAHEELTPVFRAFAANNNIRLVENDSRMSRKLQQVGKVNTYYHQLFLIFFKSHKQEAYLLDAYTKKDINALEQNRSTLIRFAEEGLAKLDTLKPFKGDGSLNTACRKVLDFHKNEAQNNIAILIEYIIKEKEFEKAKQAMDKNTDRTQEDIDQYNKIVNDFNKTVESCNKTLNNLNSGREKVLNNWETTKNRFMELHVPKA